VEIAPDDPKLSRALGEAILAIWGKLPHEIQHCVFEQAVQSQGESIRQQLAVLLHDKHPRTSSPLGKPREMMEPDSLGG
jgi:DnaJ-domain-containing protein 1